MSGRRAAPARRLRAGKKLLDSEYGVSDFHRAFKIAEQVETGGIEASLKDGVLTVRVPKAEAVGS